VRSARRRRDPGRAAGRAGPPPELWGRIAITPAGCLGLCFEGPTLVVYPEATWYVGVRREDAREIIESHMRDGRVVERLVYRPEE